MNPFPRFRFRPSAGNPVFHQTIKLESQSIVAKYGEPVFLDLQLPSALDLLPVDVDS